MSVCGICLDVLSDTQPLVTMQTDIASNLPDKLHPDPGHWNEPIALYDTEKNTVTFSCSSLQPMPSQPLDKTAGITDKCGTFEMSPCGIPLILYI